MSIYYKENPGYFKASVKSMLKQTILPDQIIIVKDGELNYKLNRIIDELTNSFPHIFTIVSLEQNVGLGLALNAGLKKSRNELVARMDTDDISIEHRCEKQLQMFEKNPDLSIVGSYINEFDKDPNVIISTRTVPLNHRNIKTYAKRRNPFNHPTVMYKKSEVLNIGGYKKYRRNQDLDLFVRMLNTEHKSMNIDLGLVLFRANEDNMKRRKSWEKCSSYIYMVYNFWKKGYSSLLDLALVAVSQIIIFLSPTWFLELVSNKFLRKPNMNSRKS